VFDRNQIIQALLNVVRNALQAIGPPASSCARVRTNISIGDHVTAWC
jgi:nitrogen-specific signal transduction histidine kinase